MGLAENHIPFWSRDGAPGPHAPFERPPNIGIKLRMTPPHLLEDCDSPDARRSFQHRHDLGIPNLSQRIGAPPSARRFLLRRQTRIALNPVACRGAETGFGGGDGRAMVLSITHIQPHLVVGDVEAGQALIPHS